MYRSLHPIGVWLECSVMEEEAQKSPDFAGLRAEIDSDPESFGSFLHSSSSSSSLQWWPSSNELIREGKYEDAIRLIQAFEGEGGNEEELAMKMRLTQLALRAPLQFRQCGIDWAEESISGVQGVHGLRHPALTPLYRSMARLIRFKEQSDEGPPPDGPQPDLSELNEVSSESSEFLADMCDLRANLSLLLLGRCATCLEQPAVRRCPRGATCESAYCSFNCLKSDWAPHKSECPLELAALEESALSTRIYKRI